MLQPRRWPRRVAGGALLVVALALSPGLPAWAEGPAPGAAAAIATGSGQVRSEVAPSVTRVPGPQASAGPVDFSPAELARITSHGPWPPVPARDAGNRLASRPEAIALGRRLFIDTRLSASGAVACVTCHQPALAYTDGRARSQGLDSVDRNAPSLWNAVHERWYGWDGAADSLWSQAIRPLLDPREMGGSAARLRQVITEDAELACRFRAVVGKPLAPTLALTPTTSPTAERDRAAPSSPQSLVIGPTSATSVAGGQLDLGDDTLLVDAAKAIAAYVGSLVSGRTAFDEFRDALVRDDRAAAAAYPLAAQRGLKLFVGQAGCGNCHVGPMFSNGEFGDIGRPFFIRPGVVDPGRQGGIVALRASRYNLLSHWADGGGVDAALKTRHLTAQHRNFGEFKVPGLRNVALTAPYMHDGSIALLDDVLTHYSELDLERLHADGEQLLKPLHFSAGERADLLAFLHTLTDARAREEPPVSDPPCDDAWPAR